MVRSWFKRVKLTPHPHVNSLSLHSMTVKISGISIISTSPSVLKIYFAIHVLKRFSSVSDPPKAVSYINLVIKVLMVIILKTPVAAVVPSLD